MTLRKDSIGLALQEFSITLARLEELRREQQWEEVIAIVGSELRRLLKINLKEIRNLTEIGLSAHLMKAGPNFWVPSKKMMLIALLKETADYARSKGRARSAHEWTLIALHFLMESRAKDEIIAEYSNLLPRVDDLVNSLNATEIPVRTRLLLMRDYEHQGFHGHAENELFAALDHEPSNIEIIKAGVAFYERLQNQNDDRLSNGGLPRDEIKSGLACMRRRLSEVVERKVQ